MIKTFFVGVYSLVIKELLALFADPRGRLVLIAPPLMQLLIFAFSATLEVKNISIAIYNEDSGKHGHEVVQRIAASPFFSHVFIINGMQDIKRIVDEQDAVGVVHIGEDFSKKLTSGEPASIQLVLDGRRSNTSQIVNGYISQIVSNYSTLVSDAKSKQRVNINVAERNWFNENLSYIYFTVPSLIGILSMIIALIVTALSVARERELGTFEQLLVSPLSPYQILIGKTIPAVLVGFLEGLLIVTAAVFLFKIHFVGSFFLLALSLFVFIMSVVGIGLFISAFSKTQQQAILGAFVFMVPAVTLSGYASPIENMPQWLQTATLINPLRYELVIIRGVFLKNMGAVDVWANIVPMLLIGAVTLSVAGFIFGRKLE